MKLSVKSIRAIVIEELIRLKVIDESAVGVDADIFNYIGSRVVTEESIGNEEVPSP